MRLASSLRSWLCINGLVLLLAGCSTSDATVEPRNLEIQQQWELQPGSIVTGRRISGGLGDISVDLEGSSISAPFNGKVQPFERDCVIYSSPELPAYLFRLCGLNKVNFGNIQKGHEIGNGYMLQFAALRKQPSGQWAIVEPSLAILESILAKP